MIILNIIKRKQFSSCNKGLLKQKGRSFLWNFSILSICLLFASHLKSSDLGFNPNRGIYSAPIQVTLSSDLPNAIIKYTLNGDNPLTEGIIYSTSISINTTTPVRAIAYNSLDTSLIESHTYIYPSDVINQPSNAAGYPTSTGLSNSITNNSTWGPQMINALQSIPTMSLVMDLGDYSTIFNTKGIEKLANIEYFDGQSSYGEPCGVNTYGNTSFSQTEKKNYRFKFKSEYGVSSFDHKIFGEDAADSYDVFDLRCGSQESIVRGGVQNIHENLLKETQIAMSEFGPHTFFCHLYINGIYWGVYSGSERPAKSFGESYFGGDKDDFNTIKTTCCSSVPAAIDGNTTTYNDLSSRVNNYNTIEQYLDIDHFQDYVLLCNYGPHGDWTLWNTYAMDNPTKQEPYRFFMWDPEPSLSNDWYYTNEIVNTNQHNDIWNPLKANLEFSTRYGDNVQCECMEDDGNLNPSNIEQTYVDMFDQHKLAYLMEAARWADLDLYNEFLQYRLDLVSDNWFQNRLDLMLDAYEVNKIYSTTKAVTYSQSGGALNINNSICLTNPNGAGSIYYTTNGQDPRLAGGAINPSAILYNGCLTLSTGAVEVKARVFNSNKAEAFHKWSSMCPQIFYVDQDYSNLVINEIQFNPVDSTNSTDTISGRNFEFIELKNIGNDDIHLQNVSFIKGITLTFEDFQVIPSDGFIVIAEDAFWFEEKYGCAPDATYSGKLDNSGENLWIIDPFDNIIDSLRYNDKDPWPATADKGYYSLALLDGTLDNADGNNWGIQSVLVTPKAENDFSDFGEHDFSGVVINEIHYNPADSIVPGTTDTISGTKFEFVEIKNITALSIDLSGAFFSRGIDYVFPDNTTIPAGGFIVLAEDKSSFQDRYGFAAFDKYDGKLDNGGETLWLNNAVGALMDAVTYDDTFPWDAQADGGTFDQSLALIDATVDNDSRLNWKVQCTDFYTPGVDNNFSCYTAPSYDGIVINELYYNPIGGSSVEFIEIVNTHPTNLYNLLDVAVTGGIQYVFDTDYNLLPTAGYPQNYIVLAKDSAAFHNAYGFAPFGVYTGKLSNSGEQIIIQDLFTNEIDQVTYASFIPWDPVPSNGQYSLALIDQYRDNSRPVNWSEQDVFHTPGQVNTFNSNAYPDYSSIVINEIYYKPPGGNNQEFIEIVNTSPTNLVNLVDLSFSHGITYRFEQSKILVPAAGYPSNYLILANDAASYQAANPAAATAYDSYDGFLVNSGELVKLVDFFGRTVDSVYYDDIAPWDVIADQGQHSLGLTDLTLDNAIAESWSSQDVSATPGLINTFADSDSDGVYDFYDICPGGDDNEDTDGDGIPDHCDNCNDYITETNLPTIMNSQQAQITIESNGTVPTNGLITYQAGQSVELMPEFEVVAGATFTAMIAPCQ